MILEHVADFACKVSRKTSACSFLHAVNIKATIKHVCMLTSLGRTLDAIYGVMMAAGCNPLWLSPSCCSHSMIIHNYHGNKNYCSSSGWHLTPLQGVTRFEPHPRTPLRRHCGPSVYYIAPPPCQSPCFHERRIASRSDG